LAPHIASLTFPVKVCVPPAINFGTTANPAHSTAVAIQTCIIRRRDINPPQFAPRLASPDVSRPEVEGVALHFLNDVFRLNLALEATEGVVY
jgi:hypothetical protein